MKEKKKRRDKTVERGADKPEMNLFFPECFLVLMLTGLVQETEEEMRQRGRLGHLYSALLPVTGDTVSGSFIADWKFSCNICRVQGWKDPDPESPERDQ